MNDLLQRAGLSVSHIDARLRLRYIRRDRNNSVDCAGSCTPVGAAP